QFKQKPKRYKDIHTGKYHTLYKDLYHLTKPLGFKQPVAVFVRNRNYAYHQKGVDLTDATDEEIQGWATKLNTRPKKCLNWKTPYEIFYKTVLHLI
ncbi:hypothetical protein QML40_11125, partial [Aerococcus urinaeequi]